MSNDGWVSGCGFRDGFLAHAIFDDGTQALFPERGLFLDLRSARSRIANCYTRVVVRSSIFKAVQIDGVISGLECVDG